MSLGTARSSLHILHILAISGNELTPFSQISCIFVNKYIKGSGKFYAMRQFAQTRILLTWSAAPSPLFSSAFHVGYLNRRNGSSACIFKKSVHRRLYHVGLRGIVESIWRENSRIMIFWPARVDNLDCTNVSTITLRIKSVRIFSSLQ